MVSLVLPPKMFHVKHFLIQSGISGNKYIIAQPTADEQKNHNFFIKTRPQTANTHGTKGTKQNKTPAIQYNKKFSPWQCLFLVIDRRSKKHMAGTLPLLADSIASCNDCS